MSHRPHDHGGRHDRGLTAFAIDGPILGPSLTFMHQFFSCLAISGDGKRVFIVRAVCKRWKALVDEQMDNGHWAVLHSCTVGDPIISRFLLARSTSVYEQALSRAKSAHVNMKAAFQSVLSGGTRPPGMYMLLDLCKQLAISAACALQRFATTFDNELRGLTYYAVWVGTHAAADVSQDNDTAIGELLQWWVDLVVEVQAHVAGCMVGCSHADREKARSSLLNFVEFMAAIPFHACRRSEQFRNEGLLKLRSGLGTHG